MTSWQPDPRQQPPAPGLVPRDGYGRPLQQPPAQPGYGGWNQPPPSPQYQPRQPPPARRRPARGLAFLGCGGLGAIIVLVAVLASSSSSSSPPAVQAAPAASTAAAKAPAAVTVAVYKGSGITSTPKFTVTGTWLLKYSFDCAGFGQAGNFIIMEDGGYGAMSVNQLALSRVGSSYAYDDAGTHYIEVNSECDWTVKIVDEGS